MLHAGARALPKIETHIPQLYVKEQRVDIYHVLRGFGPQCEDFSMDEEKT